MRISISAIGKQIKPWMQTGIEAYLSRIPKGYTVQLNLLAPFKSTHKNQDQLVKEKEAERLVASAAPSEYWIALDANGLEFTSEEWPKQLMKISESTSIRFFIGGAYGLDPCLIDQCQATWSLGKLTMPHGLARVVLTEQLYRAICLIQNHPYHKV
jgi:23S rRNA (pseudouridine1915-N3)-methyltransferase